MITILFVNPPSQIVLVNSCDFNYACAICYIVDIYPDDNSVLCCYIRHAFLPKNREMACKQD